MVKTVRLKTSDAELVPLRLFIAKQWPAIQKMLIDFEADGTQEVVLEFPTITSNVMKMVVKWCQYHLKDLAVGFNEWLSRIRDEGVSPFDMALLNVDAETVIQVILAARELKLYGLVAVGRRMLAGTIRGKTLAQLKTAFRSQGPVLRGRVTAWSAR